MNESKSDILFIYVYDKNIINNFVIIKVAIGTIVNWNIELSKVYIVWEQVLREFLKWSGHFLFKSSSCFMNNIHDVVGPL